MSDTEIVEHTISTVKGNVFFTGRERKDLETKNWRYYEDAEGIVIHFNKRNLVDPIVNNYVILTTEGLTEFKGRYCRDLETEDIHYYMSDQSRLFSFKKEDIIYVMGDTAESIKAARCE